MHPATDNITIPKYVDGIKGAARLVATTPLQVAERIDSHADAALAALPALRRAPRIDEAEFAATVNDVQMMALLGKYYAAKIRGATELALYRDTRDAAHQALSVKHLEQAAAHLVGLCRARDESIRPAPLDQSRRHRRLAGTAGRGPA